MKTLITFILFLPTLAFAQTEVKGLPVTCVPMEEAEKIVNQGYDKILIAGRSEVHGPGAIVGVFYSTRTNSYVITIMGQEGEACFIDAGYGKSPLIGDMT